MATVEQLLQALHRRRNASGKELQGDLGISQSRLSRLIGEAGPRVCALGRARARRYAAFREVPGLGRQVPVYRIDASGMPHRHGTLHFLSDGQQGLSRHGGADTIFPGLPPFAWDMKPQGYLGRGFPAAYPELGLPRRITDWTEDHHLTALARRGEDCIGNLVLGEESLTRFLEQRPQAMDLSEYPELARRSLLGQPGSSAGGEHPKFTVFSGTFHLLVKFASGDGAAADRWRDLLVCESVALEAVRSAGIPSASARWLDQGTFRFLEVERFDRVGERGRRGVISLAAVNDHFLGYAHDSWSRSAAHLKEERQLHIEAEDLTRLRWLDTFGALIGNTDRHFGNVSFYSEEGERPTLTLAPVYDMLPMVFAPRGATVVETRYTPPPPSALDFDHWDGVAGHALSYWDRLTGMPGLSTPFRSTCAECRDTLHKVVASRGSAGLCAN